MELFGHKWYHAMSIRVSFEDAHDECKDLSPSMKLASIASAEDFEAVQAFVESLSIDVWIDAWKPSGQSCSDTLSCNGLVETLRGVVLNTSIYEGISMSLNNWPCMAFGGNLFINKPCDELMFPVCEAECNISNLVPGDGQCPPYGSMSLLGGKYYQMSRTESRFKYAQSRCEGLGLEMASISTKSDFNNAIAFMESQSSSGYVNALNPERITCKSAESCNNSLVDIGGNPIPLEHVPDSRINVKGDPCLKISASLDIKDVDCETKLLTVCEFTCSDNTTASTSTETLMTTALNGTEKTTSVSMCSEPLNLLENFNYSKSQKENIQILYTAGARLR